jgi:uncharacterized protein YukJ
MALKNYGVLKGRPISSRLGAGQSPHYQIHMVDNTTDYRIAINVKSKLAPSELLYLIVDDFRHPTIDDLATLPVGYSLLPSQPGGRALDYVRGNLFARNDMRPLAHAIPGPDNDLNEKIDAYVQRAIADEDAAVYAFGERWGPEPHSKDKYFGFLPGNGVHDIHMNQGNAARFAKDNGVWQDGGLVIHYPAIVDDDGMERWPEQWVALFLAFQSQSWHTDDTTGHPIDIPLPNDRDGHVRIAAALVNPQGHDPGHETVTLVNASPASVDLTGWSLLDRNKKRSPLPPGSLTAGDTLKISLDGTGAQLSNKGGTITLLDEQGLKIDGVSYGKDLARRQGWTIVF